MTWLELQNESMKSTLEENFTSLAALEVDYDARLTLLNQDRPQDTQPLMDQLQTTVLKALENDERLHQEVSTLHQRSVPLEEHMVMLMGRVGEVTNQERTGSIQAQILPLPDWLI